MLFAGAAAAGAAGVAASAAGTGLLSSPPETVAATPSLTNVERLREPPGAAPNPGLSGEVFV